MITDRLPPHSIEAEQAVIGCVLLDAAAAMPLAMQRLKRPEVFYDIKHQLFWAHLCDMAEHGRPIDMITCTARLSVADSLDAVGGAGYIAALPDAVASVANLDQYLDIVWEKYCLRSYIRVCAESVADLYDPKQATAEVLDKVERRLMEINQDRAVTAEKPIGELVLGTLDRLEEYHRGGAQMKGLSTGIGYLDKMICGLRPGEIVVLAGRPGCGKTSLMMNLADHNAIRYDVPTVVFSLEMTGEALSDRFVFQRSKSDFQRFRTGYLLNSDIPKITSAIAGIKPKPLWVDDSSGLTIMELRARARRMARQHGIKFILIDYLQLLRPSRFFNNREQEVAEISNGLKALAKELRIPIVVLAQMNREHEKQPNRKPVLSDLRESGSVEQDADTVWFLYEPKMNEEQQEKFSEVMASKHGQDWSDKVKRVNLLVAKQRNGPTGDVELLFYKKSMHFESAWPDRANSGSDTAVEDEYADRESASARQMPTNEELGFFPAKGGAV